MLTGLLEHRFPDEVKRLTDSERMFRARVAAAEQDHGRGFVRITVSKRRKSPISNWEPIMQWSRKQRDLKRVLEIQRLKALQVKTTRELRGLNRADLLDQVRAFKHEMIEARLFGLPNLSELTSFPKLFRSLCDLVHRARGEDAVDCAAEELLHHHLVHRCRRTAPRRLPARACHCL